MNDAEGRQVNLAGLSESADCNACFVPAIWQQDTYMCAGKRVSFGFSGGIDQPGIEGSGIPGSNPH